MEEKNLKLDEDTLKKLRETNLLGFNVDSSFIYVPKAYRENGKGIPKTLWPIF